MTEAAQTREKTPRGGKRRRVDFVRPSDAQPNHPIPWRGWDVRQACPLRPAIVYNALASLHPKRLPETRDGAPRGAVVNNASTTTIQRATAKHMNAMTSSLPAEPMARRTVGHCIEHLLRKGFIELWETAESRPKHSPVGLSYRILPWDEVLQRWADDPAIATAEGTRRGFYVWGKGKRHLAPADITAWKVDGARSEADPVAHASMSAMEEPAREVPKPSAPVPPKRRLTVEEALIEDTAIVHGAILFSESPRDRYGRPGWEISCDATPENAAAVLALARGIEPGISAEAIAALCHEIAAGYINKAWVAQQKGKKFPPLTLGWFIEGMPGAVHRWRDARDRAQRATGTAQ